MASDLNSSGSDIYALKRMINKYQSIVEGQKTEIEKYRSEVANINRLLVDVEMQKLAIERDFNKIINSKGWRVLEKARKMIPAKKRHEPLVTDKDNNAGIADSKEEIKLKYDSHFEENYDFSKLGYKPEVKVLAFYLPQFHTFLENDQWWGKGFTEWTNTKKSLPRFEGHYQPREPHGDIGYYVLDNVETIKKQVRLAKQHGIYGFCFYYYWFSGKRLMEKPIDLFLADKTIKFPFCLCWANENWTRRWDGKDEDVLIKQKYQDKDPSRFIIDLKKYLVDSRYIRIGGKPVILVYDPDSIPNFGDVVGEWREVAKKDGIGEILIWSKNKIADHDFKNADYVDGEFDFAPTGHGNFFNGAIVDSENGRDILDYQKIVSNAFSERIYSEHVPIKPFYYSCTMGWDNSPRRKNDFFMLDNYSPESFYLWLSLVIETTKLKLPSNQRFVFINAWNEWAEGAYLEPDKKYGYTNINAASKAIYGLPYNLDGVVILDRKSPRELISDKKIAIQVHVFYLDIFEELIEYLEKIPFEFDLYISVNSNYKRDVVSKMIKNKKTHIKDVTIEVFDNIGRDVLPMLKQLSNCYSEYDIIGHFHTKKTVAESFGNLWREHIYKNLLGSTDNIEKIFALFGDQKLGLIAPTDYFVVPHELTLGSNFKIANDLIDRMGLKKIKTSNERIKFPVGTMFWARTDAIAKLFSLNLSEKDFPEESGQADGTMAHAIERLLGIVTEQNGYKLIEIINKT